jgi:uncharacterized membrane protein YqjE
MDDHPIGKSARGQVPGIFDSLRQLLATFAGIVQTRIELLGTEVEEQFARLSSILLWSIVALFLAFAAAVLTAVAVLVAFWESNRMLAAVLLAAGFTVLAVLAWLRARAIAQTRPHLFQTTLDELAKDRDQLGGG